MKIAEAKSIVLAKYPDATIRKATHPATYPYLIMAGGTDLWWGATRLQAWTYAAEAIRAAGAETTATQSNPETEHRT